MNFLINSIRIHQRNYNVPDKYYNDLKMFSKILSANVVGYEVHPVQIEVDFVANQLPGLTFVGLTDQSIKESKERIWSAMENIGFQFPRKKVTVNLYPSDLPKNGSQFDMAIVLGLLHASEQIKNIEFERKMFIGEIGLNGEIHEVKNIPFYVDYADKHGITEIYIPKQTKKIFCRSSTVTIIEVENLGELIKILKKEIKPKIAVRIIPQIKIDYPKFEDIIGQNFAKRALEICAAGGHSLMLYGPPGTGKTMLAESIQSILPSLNEDDFTEVSKIRSLIDSSDFSSSPPFRNPHHAISSNALIGGGVIPQPGEITLAHKGVLFLDEFNLMKLETINSIREPLDKKYIYINRIGYQAKFPADFIFICSINPCFCGNYYEKDKECICPSYLVERLQNKIKGPISDRVNLHVFVPKMESADYENIKPISSAEVKEKVIAAREIQKQRLKEKSYDLNAQIPSDQVLKIAQLDEMSISFLKAAINKMQLSTRVFFNIIRTSLTIADLDNASKVKEKHIWEALSYRPNAEK